MTRLVALPWCNVMAISARAKVCQPSSKFRLTSEWKMSDTSGATKHSILEVSRFLQSGPVSYLLESLSRMNLNHYFEVVFVSTLLNLSRN